MPATGKPPSTPERLPSRWAKPTYTPTMHDILRLLAITKQRQHITVQSALVARQELNEFGGGIV
jgi:hypothetical protein